MTGWLGRLLGRGQTGPLWIEPNELRGRAGRRGAEPEASGTVNLPP